MSPGFFRSSRALPLLGAVAVSSSLALAAAATTGMVLSHAAGLGFLTACGALPTVLVGLVWVALVRRSRLAGWLLALPLEGHPQVAHGEQGLRGAGPAARVGGG